MVNDSTQHLLGNRTHWYVYSQRIMADAAGACKLFRTIILVDRSEDLSQMTMYRGCGGAGSGGRGTCGDPASEAGKAP